MSIQLINQYYNKRNRIVQYGGSKNELSIRDPFKDLLNHYADKKNLLLIPELAGIQCIMVHYKYCMSKTSIVTVRKRAANALEMRSF